MMTGFEPGFSRVRSDRPAHCATSTAQVLQMFPSNELLVMLESLQHANLDQTFFTFGILGLCDFDEIETYSRDHCILGQTFNTLLMSIQYTMLRFEPMTFRT